MRRKAQVYQITAAELQKIHLGNGVYRSPIAEIFLHSDSTQPFRAVLFPCFQAGMKGERQRIE